VNLDARDHRLSGTGIQVLRRSSLYETEPVDFSCAAVVFELRRRGGNFADAEAIASFALQAIERAFGSRKLVARGPRVIDLDILFYGASVIRTEEMEIPHPRMAQPLRSVPLTELGAGATSSRPWRHDCRNDRRHAG